MNTSCCRPASGGGYAGAIFLFLCNNISVRLLASAGGRSKPSDYESTVEGMLFVSSHQEIILDQFTKQAVPFSSAPAMKDESALRLLVQFSEASSRDSVLDVACGPGIVVCAFASAVAHATGIDLTPAMIERARILQAEKGLANVSWLIGDINPLPYSSGSFSIVTSRYAFHHLENPKDTLAEMKRVCKAGGKVVLADVVASAIPERADAFNRMERLRDPSHVRSLTIPEIHEIFGQVGLPNPRVTSYRVEAELERLLRVSFPNEGDTERVRQMIVDSLDTDGMGVNTRVEDGMVWFSYSIAVFLAKKPDA